MLGEDARLDVGGAAGGEIDDNVESLALVEGSFSGGEPRSSETGNHQQAYREKYRSLIVLPHLIFLLARRSKPEYLTKLAGVVVEISINFFGNGFQFEFALIHLRRQRFDVAARGNAAHAADHLLALFGGGEVYE